MKFKSKGASHYPFKCDFCPKQFSYKSALAFHIVKHSKDKPCSCDICGKPFRRQSEVDTHKQTHTIRIQEECPKCGLKVLNLKHHLKRHSGIKPFSCGDCGSCFVTTSELYAHQKVHRVVKSPEIVSATFECKLCPKKFCTLAKLKKHQNRVHAPRKDYKCDLCDKFCKSVDALKLHIYSHTGERPHKCPECGKCFSFASAMRLHVASVHKNVRPFSCHICDRRFTLKNTLNKHVHTHIPILERPNWFTKCPVCEKMVAQKTIKQHIQFHDGVRPFKCDICTKDFPSNGSLKNHKTIHSGHRISCKICKTMFTHSSSLKGHMIRIHSSERPYECQVCPKTYALKADLRLHLKTHEPKKVKDASTRVVYSCVFCGKRMTHFESFYVHLRSHVGERFYGCDTCGVRFPGRTILGSHRRTHATVNAFKCEVCGKAFKTRVVLYSHSKMHSSKLHACCFCERKMTHSTTLTCHLRTHIGERPYFCRICGKEFASIGSQKYHLKTHKKKGN